MNLAVEDFVRLAVESASTADTRARCVVLWNSLSREERQQTTESRVFISFARTIRLLVDPFKHSNESPPRPDVRASTGGLSYYFDLGEITDEELAESIAKSQKTKMVSGCRLSQVDPLVKIMTQKCGKKYQTEDAPVNLLLYYWRQGPYKDAILNYLLRNRQEIQSAYRGSQFDKIWIYDWHSGEVLWEIGVAQRLQL